MDGRSFTLQAHKLLSYQSLSIQEFQVHPESPIAALFKTLSRIALPMSSARPCKLSLFQPFKTRRAASSMESALNSSKTTRFSWCLNRDRFESTSLAKGQQAPEAIASSGTIPKFRLLGKRDQVLPRKHPESPPAYPSLSCTVGPAIRSRRLLRALPNHNQRTPNRFAHSTANPTRL